MITNREEVLENALRVFAKMNYEKASLVTIAKACGLSKWGLIYYYSFKQDLFVAVVDKYIFATQDPANKFSFRGRHTAGVHRPPRGERGKDHAPHRGLSSPGWTRGNSPASSASSIR